MISPLARASTSRPSCRNWTPTARLPSKITFSTSTPVSRRRLARLSTGFRKARADGPAHAALLVDVEIADAGVVAGVEIRRRRDAHLRRRPGDRVQHLPLHARLLDPPFAAGAVMLGVAEEMIVEPLEDRADIVPAPAGEPELAPVVVVLRPGRASRSWR